MENLISNVLVVDEDRDTTHLFNQMKDDYTIKLTSSFSEAIDWSRQFKPELIITELDLKGHDGIELIQELKSEKSLSNSLFIIYTHSDDSYTEVIAFNSGADDFIRKPVSPRLLSKKIKSLQRRLSKNKPDNFLMVGDWKIDTDRYLIQRMNEKIELQKKEFEIIQLLSSQPEKIFSRDEIKSSIWNGDHSIKNRTIDVHIRKLRMKIGEDLIQTIKGIGYKI